jgi:hypothetical protein
MGKFAAPVVPEVGARHRTIDRAGLLDRPSATHLFRVHLLGRLQVRLDEVAVEDWPSGRGRSLLPVRRTP